MPELLEVEAYRRLLARRGLHRSIADVEALDSWYLKEGLTPVAVRDIFTGGRFVRARRHGKLLLAELEEGPTIGFRFGMTGRLIVDGVQGLEHLEYGSDRDESAWDRLTVRFQDGGTMRVRDPRRLGGVLLEPDVSGLGPDAATITRIQLRRIVAASRAPVKALLMDQGRIAGLGNLLSDEILWRAGIDPVREARSLDRNEVLRLWRNVRRTLDVLGRRGGSHTGNLQEQRHRDGMCPKCGVSLLRRQVGGRTSYSCPEHQH